MTTAEYQREWKRANPDKAWHKLYPERDHEKGRKYRENHNEVEKARKRRWYAAHRAEERERTRKRDQTHKAERKAKQWKAKRKLALAERLKDEWCILCYAQPSEIQLVLHGESVLCVKCKHKVRMGEIRLRKKRKKNRQSPEERRQVRIACMTKRYEHCRKMGLCPHCGRYPERLNRRFCDDFYRIQYEKRQRAKRQLVPV